MLIPLVSHIMDKESLLNAAPLLQGELLNKRQDLKENLVKYALTLSRCPKKFDIDKIIGLIDRKFGIQIDSAVVTSALTNLEKEGFVEHQQGGNYVIKTRPETTTFDDLTNPVWEEFSDLLQERNEDIDIYNLNKSMEPAFKDFLLKFFLDISESFEALSEYQIDTLYSEDVEELIKDTIQNHSLRNENTFRTVLTDYFKNPRGNDCLLEFTDNIYRGIVNIDLLSRERDSEFPAVSSLPSQNKKLFLDTNVLVNLLCETDRLHPLTTKVCEKSRDEGFDLYFTNETRRELDRLIRGAEYEMDGIYTGDKSFEAANNQFVKDFRRKDEISWEDYVKSIQDWEDYLREWRISEYSGDYEPNEKIMAEAKELLVEYENELTQQSLDRVNHDAALFGYSAQLRVRSTIDFGPFVISFHNNFTDVGNNLFHNDGLKGIIGNHVLAMQARNWLNYLMSFSSVDFDEDDRREVSLAILQGATNFEDTLSIREYSRLLVPKMGFEVEDEPYLADYLRGHPLHEELQEALDENKGDKAENISRKIIKDEEYRETVKEERRFHERLKQASSRVKEAEEKARKKDEKISELEQRLEKLEDNSGDTIIVQGGTAISGADASAEAKAEAKVEFNREYDKLIDEFEESLPKDIETLVESLPDEIDVSEFADPPDKESSISKKREWLQTASAVITISDKIPAAITKLQPQINELLAAAGALAG